MQAAVYAHSGAQAAKSRHEQIRGWLEEMHRMRSLNEIPSKQVPLLRRAVSCEEALLSQVTKETGAIGVRVVAFRLAMPEDWVRFPAIAFDF